MSNDILFVKNTLPEGTIDCTFGEPFIIRDNLNKYFPLNAYGKISNKEYFEYQKPNGLEPLVKFLENKHQAPVIITNGAKQGCAALFHAVKKAGSKSIGLASPYWGLFRPLIEMHGLSQVEHINDCDTYLLVLPNNPSGDIYDKHTIDYYTSLCKNTKKPLIHDAAYYSNVYLPRSYDLKPLGDVQVFTFSKLLGLSGLRVGYIVFHNTELYKDVAWYVENMTVGVSSASQCFVHDLLLDMQSQPELSSMFEDNCFSDLNKSKKIASQINSSILDTSKITSTYGMFLWAKCHNLQAFKDAKINVIEGTPFGAPGYIRMNLALPEERMIEIVKRLNKE